MDRKLIILTGLLCVAHTLAAQSDAGVLQGLFNHAGSGYAARTGYTQTLAHISTVDVQKSVKQAISGVALHKDVVDSALQRESQYKRKHNVFYTTQPCARLLQDIMRELYIRARGAIGALQSDAFQFLRFTYRDNRYSQFATIQSFMKQVLLTDGIIYDGYDNQQMLIPAEISLFGSAALGREATWMRFVNPTTQCSTELQKKELRDGLIALLQSYGHAATYAEKLLELNSYLVTKDGQPVSDLMQIFIPEELVDANGYLSWCLAVPYDATYIDQLVAIGNIKRDSALDSYKRAIVAFNRLFKKSDQSAVSAAQGLVKKIDEGKFKLEEYLYNYRTQPSVLSDLNYLQARLLVTNAVLLNPESGVLVYRYSQIDPQKETAYKIELERILRQMDIEKQARDSIRK